jgi:hypothetical protein
MNGFNRARGATARPRTVRNLMGQLDGTGNPGPSDPGRPLALGAMTRSEASSRDAIHPSIAR